MPPLSSPAYPSTIDQRTLQEETALYLATCRGHLDCLQSLLQAGAEPDISNKSRETPLYKGESPGGLPGKRVQKRGGRLGAFLPRYVSITPPATHSHRTRGSALKMGSHSDVSRVTESFICARIWSTFPNSLHGPSALQSSESPEMKRYGPGPVGISLQRQQSAKGDEEFGSRHLVAQGRGPDLGEGHPQEGLPELSLHRKGLPTGRAGAQNKRRQRGVREFAPLRCFRKLKAPDAIIRGHWLP